MIESYQKREIIWDPKHTCYLQRKDAWEEIAQEIDRSTDSCKKEMEYLLSALMREKMKMKNTSGTGKGAKLQFHSFLTYILIQQWATLGTHAKHGTPTTFPGTQSQRPPR